jgi:2-polyprenyl-3-methyl-5-hydroxy-6-metoxy-1,4-benzoquinol methylase
MSLGSSSPDIKQFVISLLRGLQASGRLLDFGAGRGELLALLSNDHRYSVAGIDLMARPPFLGPDIKWWQFDLNERIPVEDQFDVVVCSETIEHLENPRHVFRTLARLLRPGGYLVLTMPNQESIRSLMNLLIRGHFTYFLDGSYPAHITALLEIDLQRLCAEAGFENPLVRYTDTGAMPFFTGMSWQKASLNLLRGKRFSDNVAIVTRKTAAG